MARKKALEANPKPDETAEMIADTWGRVQVVRLTSKRGSRLVIALNLEDDTLRNAKDPADAKGNSKRPIE